VNTKVQKVVVVFKTHFDIGFTDLSSNVIQSYSTKMLPDVVATCSATQTNPQGQQFVWTMPAWPLVQSLRSGDVDPDVREQAKALIRSGQIHWHALPFTTHTDFCGLEEFIRGMYFSRQLSTAYGTWPTSAKMTDVPGHTRMLPSLLSKMGVKLLHLGSNPFSTPPAVPRIFQWEGPDGSRVVTFYNKGQYGSSLTPPDDWPFPVWLALMNTGDNQGPQKPEAIQAILDEAAATMPGVDIQFGTLDDFIEGIEAYTDILPVVRGDLADTWIHGVGSYPQEVGEIRALRSQLTDVEKALSLARLRDAIDAEEAAGIKKEIDEAFEACLLFGEHTWGMDVKKMGEDREFRKDRFLVLKETPLYRDMETSWAEKKARIRDAFELVERVRNAVMLRMAGGERVGEGKEEDVVVVFNGLGWERDGWIELSGEIAARESCLLTDAVTGVAARTRTVLGKRYVEVCGVPAMGAKKLQWTAAASEETVAEAAAGSAALSATPIVAEDCTLENSFYRLTVDPAHGVISSLFDKRTGHEWVQSGKDLPGLGQYRYDIHGDEDITEFMRQYAYRFYTWGVIDFGRAGYPVQPHEAYVPSAFRVEIVRTPGAATLRMTAETAPESVERFGNASQVSLEITMYGDEPYIDLAFHMNGKQETPFVEAGHLLLPFHLPNAKFAVHKLGQVIDPASDIVKDANHALYCCDRWVDISDGEKGMAVFPLDTPLFSIGGSGMLQFRREYEPSEPTLWFNLFNNSWGTNFPQWMGGDYIFRYRLCAHEGSWDQANVARRALETFTPLRTAATTGGDALASVLETDTDTELLCLKLAEDGDGYVLRVVDLAGMERDASLLFRLPVSSVASCNLLEVPERACDLSNGMLQFRTKPFEVHTFKVEV
jgi:alpha-mannosidase